MIEHTPTTESVRLRDFSPERLLEVVRGARFEHYILSGTKCDARLDRWSLGDFTVDVGRYNFPVRVVGMFSKKRFCLGYMRRLQAPTWVNGWAADDSTMEFYPEGAELNYRAAPCGEWVAIEFEESSLQAAARERLGHEVELPWKHVISFSVPQTDRLALDGMVARLWNHPVSGTLMIVPILGYIAKMLHMQRRVSFSRTFRKFQHRMGILRRSDEHLRHHPGGPFQLEGLARASGTTARTLQRLFNDAYGITPQKWARCLALHRARKHLQSPTARTLTVQGIAHESGFRHLGRFSAYYHELFGELPSLTLTAERSDHRK